MACASGDCYRCADGRFIVLAIVNVDREYPLLCEALGHKDWLSDERFATIYDAMKHRDIFYAQVCDAFASEPYKEIAEQLETLGVTYAEAQSMGDVIVDEQLRANGIIVETGEPDSDYPLTVGSPHPNKGRTQAATKSGTGCGCRQCGRAAWYGL